MKKSLISFLRSALVAAIIVTVPAQSFAMEQQVPSTLSMWQKAKNFVSTKAKNFVSNNKEALLYTTIASIIASKLTYDYLTSKSNEALEYEIRLDQIVNFVCNQTACTLDATAEAVFNMYGFPSDNA